ncbi:MAG: tRNA (adenosine(37)-N6)-threonylcarbamoyltransferase complex dimerization subunit type 1 TsaB [Candidatus Bipolaricaulota bacterium]|nr:tRNA (adenosine(37)-N6)-threonylcarbamoyltransferase complex dimerization subunit type 1 TsaB [Candidatus Bipolaricaulota bacterium]MCS7274635.1 tRNA (adenosine(37)-N6)-threonylcarbamoyltransferase complex dimerization subunit type 1 TsaB [Candidatus Bipolaricaulota bacterium]MDW8110935.1 tRNA (adenosine(37)-N6)-threonylcarbamoyltransferase complex dimerization subunit type 1 TsaB [Candidatus Bipolaricaulota bacterium]MDW8329105.1 tRNA (adenosine(37)-N6)-threonylcarbamoyltransferase complex d
MVALGIETSHEQGSVGLAQGEKILGEVLYSSTRGPGELLFAAMDHLLRLHQLRRDGLDLIAVALGPGSFTSLRIGMAVAKGLAQTLRRPLVGVPTAEAYAVQAAFWPKPICVVLKDRRDLVYRVFYAQQTPLSEALSLSIGRLQTELSARAEKMLCIGSGAEAHRAALESVAIVAPAALNRPSGAVIAHLGIRRFLSDPRDQVWELEPLYAQAPFAEGVPSRQIERSLL